MRYKSKELKNFSQGFNLLFDRDQTPQLSNVAQIEYSPESKSLKLGRNYLYADITGENSYKQNCHCVADNGYHFVLADNAGGTKLYRAQETGAFALRYDFGASDGSNFVLFFNEKLICIVVDPSVTIWHFYYSTDLGGTFTDYQNDFGIVDFEIINNRLYVLTLDGDIKVSNDGLSFQSWYERSENKHLFITEIEEFQGQLYFAASGANNANAVLGRFENQEPIILNSRSKDYSQEPTLKNIQDEFLVFINVIGNEVQIYSYDMEKFEMFGKVSNCDQAKIIGEDEKNIYFAAGSSSSGNYANRTVYQISILKGLFQIYQFGSTYKMVHAFRSDAYQYFIGIDLANNKITRYRSNPSSFPTYKGTYTSFLEIGEHIPIGIEATFQNGICRDNGGITQTGVNAKITALIDSELNLPEMDIGLVNYNRGLKANPADANAAGINYMSAQQFFPKVAFQKANFVYFYIKLYSDSALEYTPELYSVKYYYLPAGMENAK